MDHMYCECSRIDHNSGCSYKDDVVDEGMKAKRRQTCFVLGHQKENRRRGICEYCGVRLFGPI
jgi:hypothetical protein